MEINDKNIMLASDIFTMKIFIIANLTIVYFRQVDKTCSNQLNSDVFKEEVSV